jgi:hypothetical protein
MVDHECKDGSILMLLERGETDLETIIQRLIKEDRFTPSKVKYFWEEMLEGTKDLKQ